MFTKSLVTLSLVLSASLLTNCADRPHKPDLKVKPESTSALPLVQANDLIGSWSACSNATPDAQDVAPVKSYPKSSIVTLTFDAEGKGTKRTAYFSDEECKTVLSDADVAKILEEVKSLRAATGTPALSAEKIAEFNELNDVTKELTYFASDESEEAAPKLTVTIDGKATEHDFSVQGDLMTINGAPFEGLDFSKN